jgi:aryl-alcohol dehydrogenase-like predicted oxidoreductase
MEALNDLVRSGKVRYIGCSSCYAWEFQKANNIAEKNGWTKFVSMQNLYNLLYREEEREMYPYCADSGIAVIPWSPLARGLLTGKKRNTTRMDSDRTMNKYFKREDSNDEAIIDRVVEVAERLNRSPAQVNDSKILAGLQCRLTVVSITCLMIDCISLVAFKKCSD